MNSRFIYGQLGLNSLGVLLMYKMYNWLQEISEMLYKVHNNIKP